MVKKLQLFFIHSHSVDGTFNVAVKTRHTHTSVHTHMQSSHNNALTSCSLWSAHHLWAARSWNQLWQIHILRSSKLTKQPKRSSCVWRNFPVDGGGAVTDWLTELVSSCWAWWRNSQKSPGRRDGDQNLKSWRSETRFQGIHWWPGNKLMLMLLASCQQALLTVTCVFFFIN